MKKLALSIFLVISAINILSAQVTVTGSNGADGSWLSLTNTGGAFARINAASQTGRTIIITITGNSISESGTNTLLAGEWTSINIFPATTGLTISGTTNRALINLDGADNVTIDGRLNGAGSTADLTISNKSAGTSAATIGFINSAENNVVRFCNIKGSGTGTARGIFYFSTSSSGNGNDGNYIYHNYITNAGTRPANAVYSAGTTGSNNSGGIIRYNYFYNFINPVLNSNGIFLNTESSGWTIANNSFYEQTTFTPTSSVAYTAIKIINTGGNFSVNNNSIGGRDSVCGGGAWTKTVDYNNAFTGISVNTATGEPNAVNGNTISNINWSNSSSGSWIGIQAAGGDINIGTSEGNTIGGSSGTESVVFNAPNLTASLYGIYITSTGTIDCQNNTIGSIHALSNDVYNVNVYGIFKNASTGTTTINNNTIGSESVANSINSSSKATGTVQTVAGIVSSGTETINITNNTIANITNGTTNTNTANAGRTDGIYCTNGITTINGNRIHDLTNLNSNNLATQNASVCGIATSGATLRTIKGNTIYALSNSNTAFSGSVIGLYFAGATSGNIVSENFIHSLSVSYSSASVYGIKINSGTTTYSNNIIGICLNNDAIVYGIYETGAAGNNNLLYFNTICLGGSLSSGSAKSYALYSVATTNTKDFRNNMLINGRSTTGGTRLHYAFYKVATGGTLTCGYNNYYTSGTGGVLGFYGSDVTSLPIVTGQDVGSQVSNPEFAGVCSTTATGYVPSAQNILAVTGTGITTDYNGTARSATYPSIGAFEITLSSKIDVYKGAALQASFHSLKETFDAFNSGALKTGAFEVRIKGNVTESVSAVLNSSGTGSAEYTSISIYPTVSGITVSGTVDAPLIDLNGAANITIDGRVDGAGNAREMTLVNTSNTAVAGTAVIRFINGAHNNTVRYCQIKGSSTATESGVILFSTGSSSTGNSNNAISNNEITCSSDSDRPVRGIYSAGTASLDNSSNTISNNDFDNFLNRGIASYGIFLDVNNTGWTITGNSFYETSSFVPTSNVAYMIIRIVNSGTGFTLTNNFIGGNASSCGGTAWTKTNAFNNAFTGIYLSTGTGTVNSVQNNIIRNISWSNSLNAAWTGIQIAAGDANVGTSTGNSIGISPGTGSILVTCTTNGNNFYGINITSTGTVECDRNIIGGITLANAAAYGVNFYGINKSSSAGATTLRNNIIGSPNTANSIYASSLSTSNAQSMRGIYSAGTGTITITGNTIANITNATTNSTTGNLGKVNGIFSSSGINTIYGNLIHDLKISNANSDLTLNASICGIALSGPTLKNVTANIIYNLSNTYSSFTGAVTGIYFTGGTSSNTVERNFIHDLSVGSGSSASIYGIRIASGASTYVNNIVALKVNTPTSVFGIYEAGTSGNNNNIYFNTLHICGTVTSGSRPSYALYSSTNVNTRNFRNNLLVNTQTNSGGSGKHYAVYLSGISNLTINYNDYYVSGTGTVLGYLSGDRSTLATWQTATRQDANSISSDPMLINACESEATDYVPGNLLAGLAVAGITTDFGSITRQTPPTIGAWEGVFNKWKGTVSDDWNTAANWTSGTVPATDANIAFDAAPAHNLKLDQNRSVNNIFNATGYQMVTNGFKLTIKGAMVFSGGATINATAANSEVEFSGIAAQNIPANVFYNNSVYNLTVNNDLNVMVFGTLNLLNNLRATMGVLDASSSTPVITYGGSALQTITTGTYLNDALYDLVADNTAGVAIGSDFTVDNSLTINSGRQLIINAPNLLIVSGDIINNAGTSGLLIRSDGDGVDGKLMNNSASVNASVQLYMTGGASTTGNRIHFFVPPVQSMVVGATIASVRTNLETPYFGGYLVLFDETKGVTSQSQGWQYFDGYKSTTPFTGNAITSERGYAIYFPQDDKPVFKGTLNGGDHTYNLTFTTGNADPGGNLIGNPYPCNYDLTGIQDLMGPATTDKLDNTIYYLYNGQYRVYNVSTGVGDLGYNNIVPPMQAFWVHSNASTSITLPASYKTTEAAGVARSKGGSGYAKNSVSKVRLMIRNDDYYDETTVCLTDKATTGFDSDYDSYKWFGTGSDAPLIYTELNSTKYAINSIQEQVPDGFVIPVTVVVKTSGKYTIDIPQFENLGSQKITLKHGSVLTPLSQGTSYSFESNAGTFNDFELIFGDLNAIKEKTDPDLMKFKSWYNYNIVYISCPDDISIGLGEFKIYDSQGRVVMDKKLPYSPGEKLEIPVQLTRGLYIIDFRAGEGNNLKSKFVVF